jgi:hypothetical protein
MRSQFHLTRALAPASEVVEGHTILKRAWSANSKMACLEKVSGKSVLVNCTNQ